MISCAPARTPCASSDDSEIGAPPPEGTAAAQRHHLRRQKPLDGRALRCLATLKMAHSTQQVGLQEYLHAITESGGRIARLEQAMRDALPKWSLRPLVQALQEFRGVQLIAAPRRKFVLRYPTLEYRHEQPSHILHGRQPKGSVAFPVRQHRFTRPASQRNGCALLTGRSHICRKVRNYFE